MTPILVSTATLERMAERESWGLVRAMLAAERATVAALAERLVAGAAVAITPESVEVVGQALAALAGKMRRQPGAVR